MPSPAASPGVGVVAAYLAVGPVSGAFVDRGRLLLLLVGVAFGLHVASIVITIAVHEPLSVAIRNIDGKDTIDPAAVRAAFDEARWVAWNVVRTVATTVAFGCLAWALVLAGPGQGVPSRPAR